MASSMVKLISEVLINKKCVHYPFLTVVRHSSVKKKQKVQKGTIKHRNLISSCYESLAARDFLRSYKPYKPVENVKEIILGFCCEVLGTNFNQDSALTREDKFALLNLCFEELNHSVPNSLLHHIVNVNDIIEFYGTPVSTSTPLDNFKNQELPPNLHIQYDYLRFNPDDDIKFKGISAFPKSSTIVTSIRYKDKYRGYKADSPYLDSYADAIKNSLN